MSSIITNEYQLCDGTMELLDGALYLTANAEHVIEDHAVVSWNNVYLIMKAVLGEELYEKLSDDDLGEEITLFGLTKVSEVNNNILELFDDLFITNTKTIKGVTDAK
ncbi:MAG: hypothetical protein DRN30_06420 [Thermoplasmata archaeon]|nr:MAG: hypothetical protein DRN30_06420 [Thermoplasmata archaeon]